MNKLETHNFFFFLSQCLNCRFVKGFIKKKEQKEKIEIKYKLTFLIKQNLCKNAWWGCSSVNYFTYLPPRRKKKCMWNKVLHFSMAF